MEWAALITWLLTAAGGFVLLLVWVNRGGMRQKEPGNRIRPPLIMSHFLLAAAGLILWIVYVVNGNDTLAWIAFAALLVVALLGFTMFGIWLRRRQAGAGTVSADTPAEQHFPVAIVGLHGLLGATTLVLVLLTAVGV